MAEKRNPLADPGNQRATTRMIHGGADRTHHGETSEALYLSSGFVYESSKDAEARFAGETDGYLYSRFSNPTVDMLQNRMCLLENAEAARATATGMAAVTTAIMSQVRAGDHVVAARALFGGCRFVVEDYLPRWGVESTLVDGRDPGNFARAIKPNTKAIFIETPANPTLSLVDIAAVAEIAHAAGAVLIVDNVFATPIFQQPLALGADLVVYSATKHIDGQGRCLAGLILGSKERIESDIHTIIRQTGPSISPFNAWVMLKGLETLSLRVEKMAQSAARLAEFLANHPKIEKVLYPHHPQHPQYALGKRQMLTGSTILAFEVRSPGGSAVANEGQNAFRFADALGIVKISNNLGDAKSIITHPATTTHQRFSAAEHEEAGITRKLLRMSVGLEDADDLIDDFSFALDQVDV